MSRKLSMRFLSVLLVLSLIVTLANQGLLAYNNIVSVQASSSSENAGIDNYITYNGTMDLSTVGSVQVPQEEPSQEETPEQPAEPDEAAAAKLWSDGMIHVFHYRQLQLIGTGASLTDRDAEAETVGTGSVITDEDGNPVIYASDARYFFEGDITLPEGESWILPDDFSGEFLSEVPEAEQTTDENGEDDTPLDQEDPVPNQDSSDQEQETDDSVAKNERLYDEESDTVYIQNIYQLMTLADERRDTVPVMSNDWDATQFGTGQLIYYTDETLGYVTYGTGHNYVISSEFTAKKPEQESIALRGGVGILRPYADGNTIGIDGRDYFGQPAVTIDGTQYILIGCRRQLEAINYGRVDLVGERHEIEVSGPVYKVVEERDGLGDSNPWRLKSAELIYPGDADLIDGIYIDDENLETKSYDFGSVEDMYSDNNALTGKTYHSLSNGTRTAKTKNTAYCTVDDQGRYYIDGELGPVSNPFSDLKYERDGNYIVFRNIDMGWDEDNNQGKAWTPLMFNGTMYGALSQNGSKLWDEGKTTINVNTQYKPNIYHFNVVPAEQKNKLDLVTNMGVGFFATISGKLDRTNFLSSTAVVRNIKLSNGKVNNPYTEGYVEQTLVNLLLTGVGIVAGWLLDGVLGGLVAGNDTSVSESLKQLLNARATDPSALATGAFAGRVVGSVEITDCNVEGVSVSSVATKFENDENHKIVGCGGFVGHVQGSFRYDNLSNVLQGTADGLSTVLNLIPGLGLGDLVDVLLNNTLPVGDLIPTGYSNPLIENCTVSGGTLNFGEGRYGVGGFAGAVCGTEISKCTVENMAVTLDATGFGGGFAGVVRDDIIRATLESLGVTISSINPESEIYRCSVISSPVTLSGGNYLGGFAGMQANASLIDCTLDGSSPVTVDAQGECIGGITGCAELGSSFSLQNEYLDVNGDLLGLVRNALTGLLSNENGQNLLELGGVTSSGIIGCQAQGRVDIITSGSKAGGIIGFGNCAYIENSRQIASLFKYKRGDVAVPEVYSRNTQLNNLYRVHASKKRGVESECGLIGGGAGYLVSANVGALLNKSLGLSRHVAFRMANTDIFVGTDADGKYSEYTVKADGDYAGGAAGYAIGGDVENVQVKNLKSVKANNHAGSFVGTTGPDLVVSDDSLNLTLLGISLLSIDNLLGLTDGVHSTFTNCVVEGFPAGYTVEASGTRNTDDPLDETDFTAGGFAGDCTSVTMTDCHAVNLLSVTSDMRYGKSGGFVGHCAAGDLSEASVGEENGVTVLQLDQLLQLESDIIPRLERCDVSFHYETEGDKIICKGFVKGNAAGGFVGECRSGTLNIPSEEIKEDPEALQNYLSQLQASPYAVYHLDHVEGGKYAGGFGGKVHSGALERNGGSGLSLISDSLKIDLGGIFSITNAYLPRLHYAGVKSESGFTVLASRGDPADNTAPSEESFAGGYIGYASGADISHCNVESLKKRTPKIPANLEEKDGSAYMDFTPGWDTIPYSVAGAHYAGGYIGYMNVGAASALGDSIKVLGERITTKNLLKGLQAVVTTVEHSDVYGMPGGFSVLASSHVNLGGSQYDEKGVGYAGGFAGKIAGAHVQDSNSYNFSYIIGEVAAGGYAGEMIPGDLADILDYEEGGLADVLEEVVQVDDLVSLVQAFVPTVYNSCTTCIPCGGAVRAQSFSDSGDVQIPVSRGYAGGFVGHSSGGQIWGSSNAAWREDEVYGKNPETGNNTPGEPTRNCDAIRIRSVYGAEYAGGYVGLMEAASTAKGGGLSLLGGLVDVNNLFNALDMVYPTIENADIYGPLENLDIDTWNLWKDFVGMEGGFAPELKQIGTVDSDAELEAALSQFAYGYHVVAGRDEYDHSIQTRLSGCAGGYAGAMHSGVIRYGKAHNAKLVKALRAAGGYVGEVQTKGLADFGEVSLLGGALDLNIGQLVQVAQVLVPVIFESGVTGYQNGLIVRAEGEPTADIPVFEGEEETSRTVNTDCGMAGGFAGACYGGQLGNRADGRIGNGVEIPTDGVWVKYLKTVNGKSCIGGFVGKTTAAAVANADDSDASKGFLQGLLDTVISNPSNLVQALDATLTVIGKAEVSGVPGTKWGIVVDGEYVAKDKDGKDETRYAHCAGGFVGSSEATVFGAKNTPERTLKVSELRGVSAAYYAGGFFGLAHVGSVAKVGDKDGTTNVLHLLQTESISVLDVFRTYIYHATVTGVEDGIVIVAHDQSKSGSLGNINLSGAAGGFGGGMMNGTVENSSITGLNFAQAPNYAAGFVALSGTSSGIGADNLGIEPPESDNPGQGGEGGEDDPDDPLKTVLGGIGLGNLNVSAEVLNVIGSVYNNCAVTGLAKGFVTSTTNIQTMPENGSKGEVKGSCAAGFVGYSDMAHFDECHVTNFKFARSTQNAGGFAGRSTLNYLVDVALDSGLTGALVKIVDVLVRGLYIDEAEQRESLFHDYNSDLLGLNVLSDGNLLYVNLFGLKISAALSQDEQDVDDEGVSNAAVITIGSSVVKLPCSKDGLTRDENGNPPDLSIQLIEGNRTEITNSTVKGIADGYNIYGGCANDDNDGTNELGYAGGFIGYNDAGVIEDCSTELCDVIRGTAPADESKPLKVGPFVGYTKNRSRPVAMLEGHRDNSQFDSEDSYVYSNSYSIYRTDDGGFTMIKTEEGKKIADKADGSVTINGEACNRYEVEHLPVIKTHADLKDATEDGTGSSRALKAYVSPAMAVLMLDVPLDDNGVGDTPLTVDLKDPCDQSVDITVNKVWKDFVFLSTRPEQIQITLSKYAFDTPPAALLATEPVQGKQPVLTLPLTLRNTDTNAWTSTWQAVLNNEDLKAAERIQEGNEEKVVYYQYVISEVSVDNYASTYEIVQNSATFTITNRYTGPLLPMTGGTGVLMFYAVGAFLLVSGVMLLILRRKTAPEREAAKIFGTTDVELDLSNFSDFIKRNKK